MDITALIKENRPTIKQSSLNSYINSLKKLNNDKKIVDLNYLKDFKAIESIVKQRPITTQRAYITSILVVLSAYNKSEFDEVLTEYRAFLNDLNEDYDKEIQKHEKTDTQSKNWLPFSAFDKVRNDYLKQINKSGIKKMQGGLSKMETELLQKYVVASLYTLVPPVRLDYGNMTIIRSLDKNDGKGNFLYVKSRNKKYFIFNDFKNVKKMGSQLHDIPPKLNTVLNLWLKFNRFKHLLSTQSGNVLSDNGLSKYITKVFQPTGKTVTLNLLRHIFISENLDIEQSNKQLEIANQMMHSQSVQLSYAKNI